MADPRVFDPTDPRYVEAYDELPLWSAFAGRLLLEHVPLSATRALDLGCGVGFPVLELAERLGARARVVGIDPWREGLARARLKRELWSVPNADLVQGDGATLPFRDASLDLVVSNLGINNFAEPDAVLAEARRVLRPGGVLALTTNRMGHMRELYAAFERALANDAQALERLATQQRHRGTTESLKARLAAAGFEVATVHEREEALRFADAEALFEHHFMRLGFRAGWEEIAGDAATFERLRQEIAAVAREQGEVRLAIPFVYVEARVQVPIRSPRPMQ
jgi:ubiquinone/menaquinone biosynthesis C-methylase UbiE